MNEKEFDYINMIPFIDVMLVLLTIVLTTSTFVATGIIPVELPKVVNAREKAMRTVVIEIDREGRIFYEGRQKGLSGLRESLERVDRETPFLLRADRTIPLQGFVEVLDLVKSMGFRKVSLQTEERVR